MTFSQTNNMLNSTRESINSVSDKQQNTLSIPQKMPENAPEKQNLFSMISDNLRKLSESIGLGKFFGAREGDKNRPNAIQEFFSQILGVFYGVDISKGITISNAEDKKRAIEAFRPIIDLEMTSIDINEGNFLVYNKEKGVIEIYDEDPNKNPKNTDNNQEDSQNSPENNTHFVGAIPVRDENTMARTTPVMPPENEKEYTKGGKYFDKTQKMAALGATPISLSIADWLAKNGPNARYGKGHCARFCRYHLEKNGFKNPPRANAKDWENILKNDSRFEKVAVSSVADIPPGAILVYDGKGTNAKGKSATFGHVEIKGSDGKFYSDYASPRAGGGAKAPQLQNDPTKFEQWKRATGFVGAFVPIGRTQSEVLAYKNRQKKSDENDKISA